MVLAALSNAPAMTFNAHTVQGRGSRPPGMQPNNVASGRDTIGSASLMPSMFDTGDSTALDVLSFIHSIL